VCRTAAPDAPRPPARPELADIVRAHGPAYRRAHALSRTQGRALSAIALCRTPALGGRADTCDRCGAVRLTYNSCRNRHCPKCQTTDTQRWLAARRAEILPVPYFHVVFTLPHDLNPIALHHPRLTYDLLFQAAAATLRTFAADPHHLGGTAGVVAVLHTWGRNLSLHVHLHCIVTGGALAPDHARWIPARHSFLFPVRALSPVFRARFLDALARAAPHHPGLDNALTALDRTLRRRPWVVYCQPPQAGPEPLLDYLARYTHRVALSNDRLVAFDHATVRLRVKDYADRSRLKILTLPVDEFLRRFLLHVLPPGFVRVRAYGLLANRGRRQRLQRCRQLLGLPPPPDTPATVPSVVDLLLSVAGLDLARCPVCHRGRLRLSALLPPVRLHIRAPPAPVAAPRVSPGT
jgi:hypothetical protein